jgi:hypothetical protein
LWGSDIRKPIKLKTAGGGNHSKRSQWIKAVAKPFLVRIERSQAAGDRTKEKEREYNIARRIACWTMITGIGTVAPALLAGVAALIFWNQLGAMQRQISTDEDHFRWDQRPILAITDNYPGAQYAVPGVSYDAPHWAFGSNYGVKNYGKGTAFDIRMFEYVSILGGHFRGVGEGKGRINSDLVPTAMFWSTAVFGAPLTPDRENTAEHSDNGIIVKIIIKYCDIFKTAYYTPICIRHYNNGAIGNCQLFEVANIPTDDEEREKNSAGCP